MLFLKREFSIIISLSTMLTFVASISSAQKDDADSLYGLHWYSAPTDTSAAGQTDAEAMGESNEMWVLEINHIDTVSPDPAPGSTGVQANPWDRPEFYVNYGIDGGHSARVTHETKNHSLIYRLQPNWGRNVPYFESEGSPNNDPFTVTDYAAAAKAAAQTHASYCRVWQIGNEVNLSDVENKRWNPATERYDIPWEAPPEAYAETYLAVRNAIHEVIPGFQPAEQIVLMQANSPGLAGNPAIRFMDGNEYLYRMIAAIPEGQRNLIDGFALHGYAEPGGANDGFDGFFDSIREQLMIIDELGLGDKPVFITEFNKHMPNAPNANIGARFVQKAYTGIHDWNVSDGAWEGHPSHDIVTACWFVFYNAGGGWGDYSLQVWKDNIVSTDPNQNPWYGFNEVAQLDYPRGSMTGGGSTPPSDELWWEDHFDTRDTTPRLPDWKVQNRIGGNVTATGDGLLQLNSGVSSNSGGSIQTFGYTFSNFRAELEFTISDARIPSSSSNTAEANFDIRIREGSKGYSLTFFTDASDASRQNRVILRGTNTWDTIDGKNELIGIESGDSFRVAIIANGPELQYRIYKNGSQAPVVDWTVEDDRATTGWISLVSYNVRQVLVDWIQVGGVEWQGTGIDQPVSWVVF